MTATLNLTVEQAEAVLSGRQRYVRVPMVACFVCEQGHTPNDGIHHCRSGPDPSWVAAAKPTCETCDGNGLDLISQGPPPTPAYVQGRCLDCGGSGVPRVTVTVPCHICGDSDDPGEMIWPETGCLTQCAGCEGDGRVSAGFVRVEGPLLEVVWGHSEHRPPAPYDVVYAESLGDQLPLLAPDGPDSLIGCWVAQVEVLG